MEVIQKDSDADAHAGADTDGGSRKADVWRRVTPDFEICA